MPQQQPLKLDLKEGTLSESLGIKPEDNIPDELLRAIIDVKIPEGEDSVMIHNPSMTGDMMIKVTKLMKQRANFANVAKNKWGMGN